MLLQKTPGHVQNAAAEQMPLAVALLKEDVSVKREMGARAASTLNRLSFSSNFNEGRYEEKGRPQVPLFLA